MYSPYPNALVCIFPAKIAGVIEIRRGKRVDQAMARDSEGSFWAPTLGWITLMLVVLALMATALPVQANDDGCFRLPNGTKFCAKPPARDRTGTDAGQKKPGREVASDRRRNRAGDGTSRDRASNNRQAIRAAGGLAYLVEQFDASRVPSLEVIGPCLCRDGSEPVYGFCTEGNKTYKASCS